MAEYRVPTTTKVTEMIQAHADLLEQHGISAGLESARPAAGAAGRYYFSTDTKVWARDNGTSWDVTSQGLSEAYIQSLIDASISAHAGVADAHHAKYTDPEAQTTVKDNVEVGDLKTPTKDLPMGSQKITGLATPTALGGAATKGYVDSKVQGLDWQPSVLDELDTPPGTPTTGDRYLVIATATGDWVGHENDIAEWNGASWDFTTPNTGFAVWIEDVGRQKNYNGTDWIAFGSTVDHGNLVNVTPDAHHKAPAYDSPNDEVVFQI
ncbi:hypothetical protein ES708_17627 [subsurface metagenome]